MKIKGKILSLFLLGTLAALVLFALTLSILIEKNRDRIQKHGAEILGRAFAFEELHLSFWGGLGLSAKQLRIAENPRFAATPLLQAKEARITLRLLPLLWGKVQVKRFVLVEPEVQVIRNEAGELNLAALAESEKAEIEKPEKAKKSGELPFARVSVSKGKVIYIDRSLKEPVELQVRNLDLDLKGSPLWATINFKLAASLLGEQSQNVHAEGRIGPTRGRKNWSQHPVDLKFSAEPLLLPELARAFPLLRERLAPYVEITGPLAVKATLTGSVERPVLREVSVSGRFFGSATNNGTLKGRLDFSKAGSWEDGAIDGKVEFNAVTLDNLRKISFLKELFPPSLASDGPWRVAAELKGSLRELAVRALVSARESDIRYGTWLKKEKGIPADLKLNLLRQKSRLLFENSTLTLHNLKLDFSGLWEELPERSLALRVRSDAVSLSGWERLLPPLSPYSASGNLSWDLSIKKNLGRKDAEPDIRGFLSFLDVQAKEKRSGLGVEKLTARISFGGKGAKVDEGSLRVGSSEVAFQAHVPNVSEPILYYSLRSPKLSLAHLAGNKSSGELRGLISTGAFDLRKGTLVLEASLSSPEGSLEEIAYRNLEADITLGPKTGTLHNLFLRSLGGTFRASASWELGGATSSLALNPSIESVDVKALLERKFPRFKDQIDGRLSLQAKLRSAGLAWYEGLEGGGQTEIREGSLKGFNLVEQVLSRVTGLPGISSLISARLPSHYRPIFQRRDTPFDSLKASFTVKKERIYLDNLLLVTPDYAVTGDGWIGLDKTVRLSATLVLAPHLTRSLIEENRSVRYLADAQGRLSVPFRLEGTLPNVQAKPDLQNLLERLQRGALRRGAERALKPGGEKDVQDLIQKGLEQFFRKP